MTTVKTPRERTPAPALQSPSTLSQATSEPRLAPSIPEILRAAWADPATRPLVFGAIGSLLLIGWIFWANIRHFLTIWWNDENYSHGFLVPFISYYFANEAVRRGPIRIRSGLGIGSAMILFAVFIKLATILILFPVASDYGLIVGLAGVCAILLGSDAVKRVWFAFVFLVFLVPLPVALYSMIANPLQLMVSSVSTSMLNVLGIPALCEGNLITLAGNSQLFVAEACSGMRQLTGFLALTTAWAYLSARPLWNRILLIGSSIPIAMTANVVRVTLTGVISYGFDPKYASGAFHTLEGLAMMGLGLFMLATFSFTLDQITAFFKRSSPPTTPFSSGEPTLTVGREVSASTV